MKISTRINGESHDLEVADTDLLVDLLRDTLELTGTHIGCETGQCGACVVHLNGDAIKSCLMLAAEAD